MKAITYCYLVDKSSLRLNLCVYTGKGSRPATQSTLVSTIATNIVPVREGVSLKTVLAAPNELEDWRRNDLPMTEQAVNNALILRSCGDDRTRAWPLLIDPHNQAELWIRALHQGTPNHMCTAGVMVFFCKTCSSIYLLIKR